MTFDTYQYGEGVSPAAGLYFEKKNGGVNGFWLKKAPIMGGQTSKWSLRKRKAITVKKNGAHRYCLIRGLGGDARQ